MRFSASARTLGTRVRFVSLAASTPAALALVYSFLCVLTDTSFFAQTFADGGSEAYVLCAVWVIVTLALSILTARIALGKWVQGAWMMGCGALLWWVANLLMFTQTAPMSAALRGLHTTETVSYEHLQAKVLALRTLGCGFSSLALFGAGLGLAIAALGWRGLRVNKRGAFVGLGYGIAFCALTLVAVWALKAETITLYVLGVTALPACLVVFSLAAASIRASVDPARVTLAFTAQALCILATAALLDCVWTASTQTPGPSFVQLEPAFYPTMFTRISAKLNYGHALSWGVWGLGLIATLANTLTSNASPAWLQRPRTVLGICAVMALSLFTLCVDTGVRASQNTSSNTRKPQALLYKHNPSSTKTRTFSLASRSLGLTAALLDSGFAHGLGA